MSGTRCFIGVGSNIDPARNVPAALARLAREVSLRAVSTFHRTRPIGHETGPEFWNGVVEIETTLAPRPLKYRVLRGIEAGLGRNREDAGGDRYAPRSIDLDLLIFGEMVLSQPGLTIPDPDIERRVFVAVPLHELAPELLLPGSGRPISEIVARLVGTGELLSPDGAVRVQW